MILQKSPIAYANHKIVLDENNIPCDYIFLEVNEAFEKMTGLKKENVIGKKVTQVIPNIKEDDFDWIKFYGEVALNKSEKEITSYSKILNRYYKIVTFSQEKEYFTTLFLDVTKETIISNRYEILFKNNIDAIVYFDKNNIVVDVNETFLKMFKYKKEECIGKNLDELVIIKEKRDEGKKNTINLFKEGTLDISAIRYTKELEPIYVDIRGMIVRQSDQIIGGYAIYTDVTETVHYQKQIESTNEELEATICQLTANEEELRAQYDEIQEYLEKNEELKQKYEIAIRATGSFVWEIDKNFKLTHHISQDIKNILGIDIASESIYEIINQIVLPRDRKKLIEEFKKNEKSFKNEINTQIRVKDIQGNIRWYLVKGKKITDRLGNFKTINGVLVEITDMKQKEEHIRYLAEHDSLTGIYNRRKFRQVLKEAINKNKQGTILLLDLDNFKNINDTLGHLYGDKILRKIVETLKALNLKDAQLFRVGGDEFVIHISKDDIHEIKLYARNILKIFREKIKVEDMEQPITASIGIVRYPLDGKDIDDLFKKADIAMYKAKFSGKNKYLLFNEEMKIEFNEKINIENILRKAIKEEKLLIKYQPVVDVDTGKTIYFEALLRLENINISPAVFIPTAEESEIIIQIGKWVIAEVAGQIKKWKEKGLPVKPVAINISPKQFSDSKFIKYLVQTIKQNEIDPSLIELEITENVLLENKQETIERLNAIKKLGIKIALDDFGTGYSSLNYLTYMPIDKIKMDKSLKDKFIELDKIQIIDSMISIAHGLGLKVVAEGVEELEEYKRLKKGKCDYMQGYFFSKPVGKEEAEKILDYDYKSF
ncbi:PAS domain S-box-containing protein/diguanylate cyclase (GGDEF) domain-containing protein [Alkalithermobacter thermoalcaliphilus JW-YL-7 = DSM 7308]|uniref:Diguanylate cyclase/phosphodiesterase with PAS/PAC sensor(S) n=2 Tax=Clostridium paradoxum TaxID=29346 RepID=A0A150FNN6_CLOPD|nr:diguanylate cyclase/phosphodiesterase with PAS/PAC sensor(s) [[Clostridium] paradoxum JW-YL-7 = DSM 7308]SHK86359.1 PAS domain S-box-containing protein/diguanylate cyclase (GGDEF) domain-containing protein [[Clostridium] paradoxum JW-YL-7 = DSM 7308]